MTSEIAIKVSNVTKSFKLPHEKQDSVKGLFLSLFRKRTKIERQHVLKGISFEVKKGEFLGIVGRNGGGKSTTLKLLAQIYEPDSGEIYINGNLTPFIELGVGFNPELTGRENVYLNGALLGFTAKQMNEMYDNIVKFAELERFMDQKLKNYSSGMQVRLAFSVAIQAKTDILLIDEVLAVGDANFQKKCFDVFEQFKAEGRTVVFISHSMQQVVRFCDRVILINKGAIVAEGDPEVVATEYEMLNSEEQKDNKDRIRVKTIREAHIIDDILNIFNRDDRLLEVGAGSGRIIELINSLNIDAVGVDGIDGKQKGLVKKTLDQISKKDITGIIITDNLKSLNDEQLKEVYNAFEDSSLSSVDNVYIHFPHHTYQEYIRRDNKSAFAHQHKPRDALSIIDELTRRGFALIKSDSYGEDPYQYRTFVLKRFNEKIQELLWGSSES